MWDRAGAGALSEDLVITDAMQTLAVKEPLILFHVDKAIEEGRDKQNAVEGWWRVNPQRASRYNLVLAKESNVIIGAYRPIPDSWCQRGDSRWGFKSERADDVWDEYVGKSVPEEYRGSQNPVRYLPV